MLIKRLLFFYLFFAVPLFSQIENSIISQLDQLCLKDFEDKISEYQKVCIQRQLKKSQDSIRIMTFNLLFDMECRQNDLEEQYLWKNRKKHVLEYLNFVRPDILCTQELFIDQIEDIRNGLGKEYSYYGKGREDGDKKGSIEAIFYKKNRFSLLEAKTYEIFEKKNIFGIINVVTFCKFLDQNSKKSFGVFNTHLDYRCVDQRLKEVKKIKAILGKMPRNFPIVLAGDFNTFPMRYDVALPFYDGTFLEKLLTSSSLKDAMRKALLGHLGPISTSTFCPILQKNFSKVGTPGVILDHIFVNEQVDVIAHAIDPAKVDGMFPSDHLPVIADIFIP